ncbi:MAG: hypothetical protein ACEPOW_12320 [Bacteroidales bacterium]
MKTKQLISILFLLLVSFLFTVSCSTERSLAYRYLSNYSGGKMALIVPQSIIKENLVKSKMEKIGGTDSLFQEKVKLLRSIDESKYADSFMTAYIKGLESFGFKVQVYPDKESVNDQQVDYLVSVAQVQITEYSQPTKEESQMGDFVYSQDFLVENILVSSWFEISSFRYDGFPEEVVFAENGISEGYSGKFKETVNGKIHFDLSKETILPQDVYFLGKTLGTAYAKYTFNFFMNMSIKTKLGRKFDIENGYSFDPKRDLIYPRQQGFIPLD